MANSPRVVILAGPNGAGKSTAANVIILNKNFVNADNIAREMADIDHHNNDLAAGRLALTMIDQLGIQREDFVIETTLASRSLAPKIRKLKTVGYEFQLIFFWLPSPELAIERVAARVRMGGHDIPEKTIRRRYHAGIRNFFNLYRPISDTWRIYLNLDFQEPNLVAEGNLSETLSVYNKEAWRQIHAAFEEGEVNDGSK